MSKNIVPREEEERWIARCASCGEEFQVPGDFFFTPGASKIICLRCGRNDTLGFGPPKPSRAKEQGRV